MSAPPIERRLAATEPPVSPSAAYAAQLVADAPELSAERRDRLAALLRGGGTDG